MLFSPDRRRYTSSDGALGVLRWPNIYRFNNDYLQY